MPGLKRAQRHADPLGVDPCPHAALGGSASRRFDARPTSSGGGTPRAAGEEGFTLVELLVTLAVIATGVVGTLSVFLATMDATAVADARSHATALASREVEKLEAIPWDQLGFSTGQPGFRSTYDGGDTVVVASPQSTPLGGTEAVDGLDYTIVRDIVWHDTSAGDVDAFKRLIATISWTDGSGSHEVVAHGGVYALGNAGAPSPSTTTTLAPTPGTPTGLTATKSVSNPTTQVDLTWVTGSPIPGSWEVQFSSDGQLTWVAITDSHPGDDTTYSATGLADGTEFAFRVRGVTSGVVGAWSNIATAVTDWDAPECQTQAATADPGSVKKKNNPNTLLRNVVLEVSITGDCGDFQALITTSPGTTYTEAMDNSFGNGGVYRYTIWKNQWSTWSTGNKSITVKQVSTGDVVTVISLVVTN